MKQQVLKVTCTEPVTAPAELALGKSLECVRLLLAPCPLPGNLAIHTGSSGRQGVLRFDLPSSFPIQYADIPVNINIYLSGVPVLNISEFCFLISNLILEFLLVGADMVISFPILGMF